MEDADDMLLRKHILSTYCILICSPLVSPQCLQSKSRLLPHFIPPPRSSHPILAADVSPRTPRVPGPHPWAFSLSLKLADSYLSLDVTPRKNSLS